MRTVLLAALISGCAWAPQVSQYPSGLRIVRLDQHELDQACGDGPLDDGSYLHNGEGHIQGCYARAQDTIYLLNSCEGAKSLPHELAHREGVAHPSEEGFDW